MHSRLKTALLALSAVAVPAASQAAVVVSGGGLQLAEQGGTIAPANLGNGATPFAPDIEGNNNGPNAGPPQPTGYSGFHTTTGVVNQTFGNPGAWLAGSSNSAIGLALPGGSQSVQSIAFGRDNTSNFNDRTLGQYTLQYTNVAAPDLSTTFTGDAATGWTTIGTLDYQSAVPGNTHFASQNFTAPSTRHRYNFTPVTASGLRIVTAQSGNGVDEFEAYSTAAPVYVGGVSLAASGGSGAASQFNVASSANGSTAFAKDVYLNGTSTHTIPQLNDGLYGNSKSWLGANSGAAADYAGVDFAGTAPITIDQIAFGRDNTGQFSDRAGGVYTLQYTTVTNPDASTPDSAWTSLDQITYDGTFPTNPAERHLFQFDPVSATGIRIVTSSDTLAIDELEAFNSAVPEPASLGLIGFAGMLLARRRRGA